MAKSKARKRISSANIRIAVIEKSNPRREGTRAHKAYASMLKVTGNGRKVVPFSTIIEKTKPTYRYVDRDWDVQHGAIKIVPVKRKA